jgi:FlaA1/EpsC-like NDP-sugar epimerase
MFRERARVVDAVRGVADLFALGIAFPIAYAVRDGLAGGRLGWPALYPFRSYRTLVLVALAAWVAASALLRLYGVNRIAKLGSELQRAARVLLVVAAALAGIAFLARDDSVSRAFIVLWFGAGLALLVANRVLLRRALGALRARGYTTRIAAVVGTGDLARRIGTAIQARVECGYHLAGYVEEDGTTGPHRVGPVLGSFAHGRSLVERLAPLLATGVLDEVLFAVPQERLEDIEDAVMLCRKERVTARICLDLAPARSRLSIDDVGGVPVLGLHER